MPEALPPLPWPGARRWLLTSARVLLAVAVAAIAARVVQPDVLVISSSLPHEGYLASLFESNLVFVPLVAVLAASRHVVTIPAVWRQLAANPMDFVAMDALVAVGGPVVYVLMQALETDGYYLVACAMLAWVSVANAHTWPGKLGVAVVVGIVVVTSLSAAAVLGNTVRQYLLSFSAASVLAVLVELVTVALLRNNDEASLIKYTTATTSGMLTMLLVLMARGIYLT